MGIWRLGACILCSAFKTAGFVARQRENLWGVYEIETSIIKIIGRKLRCPT
jgi:hypothetical protein